MSEPFGYLTQAITDTTNVNAKLFNGARSAKFHTHVTSSLAGKFYATYNGTDYTPIPVINWKTGAVTGADTTVTPADESVYVMDCAGAQGLRFTPSAGTGTIAWAASDSPIFSSLTTQTVTLAASTSGGAAYFQSLDLDESEEDVKTSAGTLYGFTAYNLHASTTYYLKFYNATAANVTVGTTAAALTYTLDADKMTGFMFTGGIEFTTAICVAAESGLLDDGAPGAPGTNEVVIQVFYK